ncbi:MAG: hypothetical protein KAU22_12490 [Desulfuromonadales bacterium]|nr:hypothetical protein [Desulfuromonadales bacterium]
MINLIDELKAIPGVVGASIVAADEGLKATNLPAFFKPERLLVVGNHLLKLYAAGQMSFSDLTDITLNFDESVVVARALDKSIILFVICEPTFNNNLLNMSLNLLQDEFKSSNFATTSTAAVAPTPAPTPTPTPQAGKDEGLEDLFAQLESGLGKILGPMAEFIFAEVIEKWTAEGAANYSRIDELIKLINQEIIDVNKIEKYNQLIASALKEFQKG